MRDVTAERAAFAVRICAYVAFAASLAVFARLFDFARIRIVIEDRRRAVGRHCRLEDSSDGTCVASQAVPDVRDLVAAFGLAAVGAPRAGVQMWMTLRPGQAYIIGRHYLRLLVYASETALFQRGLAQAGLHGRADLRVAGSAGCEAIVNAEPTTGAT